ncbi:MAG: 50S ribosomal protein L3 N(5)-glutamine methyltransferase [Chromatiales bacterium]|nr:50S ribosomal protein L3 N(5)-glutamine methyltransferase [Chromatiales bacterium]
MKVAELIEHCADEMERAELWFGHGTDNALDEAAWLVGHALGVEPAQLPGMLEREASPGAEARAVALLDERVSERKPLAYLLGEAWFAGLPFHVDEHVLVPRSPFAELIAARFSPWLPDGPVRQILEIGTGSGCIAVALALAFPEARIIATDISAPALAVARRNVLRHGLGGRLALVQADLFAGLTGPFDLIVSNPPYVPADAIDDFPAEYLHEPRLALASGADGLETPVRILQHARQHLAADGLLALEVGAGAAALETRFPQLPFSWPDFAHGGDGIALVGAGDLERLAA